LDSEELARRFRLAEIRPAELRVILWAHFRSARQGQGNTVDYMRGDEVALSVEYVDGRVDSVRAGPRLADRDVVAIETAVTDSALIDHGRKVWREIVFAGAPVTGSWRYHDLFQIVPAPAHAPRPPAHGADHPFVLEVAYASSPDSGIVVTRAGARLFELNLLLAAFVPLIDARPRFRHEQRWAIPLDDSASPPRSIWTQQSYMFEPFQTVADDFTTGIPTIASIADGQYYAPSGINRALRLPESLEQMFDQYLALDPGRGERILRWAYWLNHAQLVSSLSTSAHYLAIIQSIEAVRPKSSGSAGEQFADFLDTHVPRHPGEPDDERIELYRLRSQLAHGQELMVTDLGGSPGDFHPAPIRDRDSAARTERLARLAGINWLLGGAH
jgi:hypothetical protein